MDAANIVLEFLKLSGIVLASAGVILALTKGRKALAFTGGGVLGKVMLYIMIATVIYLIAFVLDATGELLGSDLVEALNTIALFGLGVCFFSILWEIIEHLEEFKKFTE